ncbi:MAG: glycosyltransferase family 2 protein [Pseudomonadota bacterium]
MSADDQPGPTGVASAAVPETSLIVSTLGRAEEIPRLLRSLAAQQGATLELIVVDQNDDQAIVAAALAGDWGFEIVHLHRPGMRGLSRGRNAGLASARAPVLGFPDDDCWYPPDFLARGLGLMRQHGADFVCGRAAAEDGRSINGRYETVAQAITQANVFTTGIEWAQLMRRDLVDALGGYDENIGIGASSPWQSAEGQDMMLRLLGAGGKGWFEPTWYGHHAELDISTPDDVMIRKMRGYARGLGHVLRKHRSGPLTISKWLARSAGGAMVAALRGRVAAARMYANILLGRTEGLLGRTFD